MSGAGRTGVAVLATVGLLALVAIASGGRTPLGERGDRRPAEWLVDVAVSLLLVWMAIGAVLWIVVLVLRPQELVEPAATAGRRRNRVAGVVFAVALFLVGAIGLRRLASDDSAGPNGIGGPGTSPLDGLEERPDRYEPQFATIPVVVVLALVAIAVVALVVAHRARRRPVADEVTLAEAVADVLDDTLDDIRAEQDPRRAVIAAYARLERVLAAHALPRRPSEAPEEYLARALHSLALPRPSVTRLTALFETAKFSLHEIDAAMKEEAVVALTKTRDELRAARERAESERLHALELARGASS